MFHKFQQPQQDVAKCLTNKMMGFVFMKMRCLSLNICNY